MNHTKHSDQKYNSLLRPAFQDIPPNPRGRILIAGPCSAESREQVLDSASGIAALGPGTIFRAGAWKPRTSPGCFEGVGAEALKWIAEAGHLTGMPVATEVASPDHVELACKAGIDIFWIGARQSFCRTGSGRNNRKSMPGQDCACQESRKPRPGIMDRRIGPSSQSRGNSSRRDTPGLLGI